MKIARLDALADEPVSHNAAIVKRVFLRNGEVPNVTQFARSRFAPGQVAGAHAHADMAEVFFVESGSGTIVIDDVPTALTPGTCVAVLPHEMHELRNDGAQELVLVYFGVRA